MYGNSYNYPPDNGGGGSQQGRGKVGGGCNENEYPGAAYGQPMSQGMSQGHPYYPPQEMSRRPLQVVQLENSQQMAPRSQQEMFHGHYPPQVYSPHPPAGFDRPYGYGRGYGEPMDHQSSYRQPGQHAGFGGPTVRPFQGQPYHQDPSMSIRPHYPRCDSPIAGVGYSEANRMYCEPPPMYSSFTPTCTSTPITTAGGAATTTDSVCSTMSTGRGFLQPKQEPSGKSSAQQPPHVAVALVPIWARPAPKAQASGAEDSRNAASVDSKALSSKQPAALSRGASPAPSTASSAADFPRRQAAATIERGIRVITGTVDNIMVWGRKLEEEARPHVLFEIVGSLDSVVSGQWYSSQMVTLRGLDNAKNATLSAVFWEIERQLRPPPLGSIVACVCRLGPRMPQPLQAVPQRRLPRMQVLKMRVLSPGQVVHYKRLAYVSSHAVSQGALSALFGTAEQAAAAAAPAGPKQTPITAYASTAAARTSRP